MDSSLIRKQLNQGRSPLSRGGGYFYKERPPLDLRETMDKLKKKHFDKQPEAKRKGKKLDPLKVLAKAYAEPKKVAEVGGKGYV